MIKIIVGVLFGIAFYFSLADIFKVPYMRTSRLSWTFRALRILWPQIFTVTILISARIITSRCGDPEYRTARDITTENGVCAHMIWTELPGAMSEEIII